jgi:hypothetical protein
LVGNSSFRQAALRFINGPALGDHYDGHLIVGSAMARAGNPGHLYRFRLNGGRNRFEFDDDRLKVMARR